jgi:NAD(P)-dependent dehydrogenase (short-subunit alcohol dehydrogenase family)
MTSPVHRLGGKVAMVTGAGGGIGAAVARRCASEGADVVLAGRARECLDAVAAELSETGRRTLVVPLDQRDEGSVETAVAQALHEAGRVDVLVANSGVPGPTAPFWEVSAEDWAETLTVNLTGTFLVCRAVARHMVVRRAGSMVVVGSATGKRPLAGRVPYAAAKTGLVGLVRSAAADLGPYGVRVNLVSPGAVAGDRLDRVVRAMAESTGSSLDDALRGLTADSPLRTAVTAEQVAATVCFLASDEAAGITGEDVNVSAGAVMY